MTLQEQLLSLYTGDDLVRMQHAVLASGLPPDDFYFIGAIEARRATLAAEGAREEAKAALERSDRALTAASQATAAAKETSTKITAAVTSALDENRQIQSELGSPRILTKAILSRTASALIALSLGVAAFFYLQSRQNSQLAKFIAEENRITSASNSAFIEKSLEIARRGTFSAAACYSVASALSLPSVKAAWSPGHGAALAFKADQVKVLETNNQIQIITDAANSERFRGILSDIRDGGFIENAKEAHKADLELGKPSTK